MKVRSYEEIDKILKKVSKGTLETLDMCFEMWLDNKISKNNLECWLNKVGISEDEYSIWCSENNTESYEEI